VDANTGAGSAFDDGVDSSDGLMTWANANASDVRPARCSSHADLLLVGCCGAGRGDERPVQVLRSWSNETWASAPVHPGAVAKRDAPGDPCRYGNPGGSARSRLVESACGQRST
jgi:hypothetical protein